MFYSNHSRNSNPTPNYTNEDSIENLFAKGEVYTDGNKEKAQSQTQIKNKNNDRNKDNWNNISSSSKTMLNTLKKEENRYSNKYVDHNNKGLILEAKLHNTKEEHNKEKKYILPFNQENDIYNYNTKHEHHKLKKKYFGHNDNIMTVRSLNLDKRHEDNEKFIEKETKSSRKFGSNNYDKYFAKKEFKVEKIKEPFYKNKSDASKNDENKIKKNVTNILPFDKIIEENSINNILTKENMQPLYSHRNIYEECTSNYNNKCEIKNLGISCNNYQDIIYKNNKNTTDKNDLVDTSNNTPIFSKIKNNYIDDEKENTYNTEINKYIKNGINIESDNNTLHYQKRKNVLNEYRTEQERIYNRECDNLKKIYDSQEKKNTKYYLVVNHYNPYENNEKSPEKRISDIYNQNVYENDIYDYLLNQYEKNYKKLILQNQPIRKALTEYFEEENDKDQEVKHNKKNESKKEKGEEEEQEKNDIGNMYYKMKRLDYGSSECDNSSYNSSETEKEKEKEKERRGKKERKEGKIRMCKLVSKKGTDEKERSFSSYSSELSKPVYDFNSTDNINKQDYEQIKNSHLLFNEDTYDIYKDTECIYTHKPEIFAYTINPRNNNGDTTLKINKEFKKIFKKMKNKHTVVISNIGKKSGSSTFSNFVINNSQINNFTDGINIKEECVYAYITTNKNKINYIYLDFNKINVNRNNPSKRKNDKNDKQKIQMKSKHKVNKLMNLSFYFSNIVILHIDNNNFLDIFFLIADYYTLIKNIKKCIRQKRKKYKTEKRKIENMNNQKENFLKLNKNSMCQKYSMEEPKTSESSYLESDDSNKDLFDEDNFYFPYFIFIFKDMNESNYNIDSGNSIIETLTGKKEDKGQTEQIKQTEQTKQTEERKSLSNYKNVQEYLEYLIFQIEDKELKRKVQYVFSFLRKKNFAYLPSLYTNNTEKIINYEYMNALKKIKRDLFMQSKSIDSIYKNNGLYIYKYLNMITYTINNDIYYSPDNLKRKIEIFENKMLHDVLTENFLIKIRNRIEKILPIKADFLLTITNEQKVDFILTYERLSIGNESIKKKYKDELIKNIDNTILKAYKENLAYSYFIFFNEINKKIENLKIAEKINNHIYENFDELLVDLNKVNDEDNENFVYNEIFNKAKEDIIAQFVKTYYHDYNAQTKDNNSFCKKEIHNSSNNIQIKKGKTISENNSCFSSSEIKQDAEKIRDKNKYEQQDKRNKEFNKMAKNNLNLENSKKVSRNGGKTEITTEDGEYAEEKEGEEYEASGTEEEEKEEEEDEDEEYEENEEAEEKEEKEDEEWEKPNYSTSKKNSKYNKNSKCMLSGEKSIIEGSALGYTNNVQHKHNDIRNSQNISTLQKLSKMKNLKKIKKLQSTNNSYIDMDENSYTKDSSIAEMKIKNSHFPTHLKNSLHDTLYKNKSDRCLNDQRKKQISKLNPDIQKYYSANYPNNKSNIHIYKHLTNYENLNSSQKIANEFYNASMEYNKDSHHKKSHKQELSFNSTQTDSDSDANEEHSKYMKKQMKQNSECHLKKNKKLKFVCFPRSAAKSKKKNLFCSIM